MNLDDYLKRCESAAMLAARMHVPSALLSQWRTGVRPIPVGRCVAIERLTAGKVTRQEMRPEDWDQIWPELAGCADAIHVEQTA